VISLACHRNTPGLLNAAGFALLAAAAAVVIAVPDDSTVAVVAQVSGSWPLTAGTHSIRQV
jgi:hypothetical protein